MNPGFRRVVVGIALAISSCLPLQAGASLIGDTVGGVLVFDGFAQNWFEVGDGGTGNSAVVGGGVEFSSSVAFSFPVQADLAANTMDIIQFATGGPGSANGFIVNLNDLDFLGGATIIGVNVLVNEFAPFTTMTFAFGSDSITVDIDGYNQPGTFLRAQFEFVTSAVVPEPASLALLGLGLLGLGVMRRRS